MINRRIMALALMCALPSSMAMAAKDKSSLEKEVETLKRQQQSIMNRLKQAEKSNTESATEVAGYAEVHYNNLNNKLDGGADKKEIDLHRAVIEVEHHFSDKVRAEIEIEFEHAFLEDTADGSSNGEVEVEQAFVEFTFDQSKLKLGQFILPVGLINKKHKPTAFYGVERNPVETNIIPTTWWEAGVLYNLKPAKDVSLNLMLHSGLNTSAADNYAIRKGRQKGSEASAEDLAYTINARWQANPNLMVGGTFQHQGDITQSTDPSAGDAQLIEAHAQWQQDKLTVRALYATWDLDGSGPAAIGADEQKGWYVEPAYRINQEYGAFVRYSQWDNQAGSSADTEYSQVNFGLNYWPLKNVVVKVDYQDQDAPSGADELDGINLGVGFYF